MGRAQHAQRKLLSWLREERIVPTWKMEKQKHQKTKTSTRVSVEKMRHSQKSLKKCAHSFEMTKNVNNSSRLNECASSFKSTKSVQKLREEKIKRNVFNLLGSIVLQKPFCWNDSSL